MMNDKTIQVSVGENIEHIRLVKKKSIKEVAAAIRLTGSGYRNIERGITDISLTRLFHLATVLDVNPIQLLLPDVEQISKMAEKEKTDAQHKKQMEENNRLRMQQYKDENNFLKKQIEILENFMSNRDRR